MRYVFLFLLGGFLFPGGVAADNYALKFTAGGQYVELHQTTTSIAWTAEFWLYKYASKNYSSLMNGATSKIMLESWNNAHKIGLTRKGVADWAFNYVVPLNQWTHIAMVCDGTSTKLYVNGVLTDEMAHAAPLPLLSLGMAAETPWVIMDEVRLWNITRTATEIAGNMDHSVDVSAPGLIGYYYFDDRNGEATDLSPSQMPGIIHGAVYVKNDNPDFTTTLPAMKITEVKAENYNEYFVVPGSRDQDLLRVTVSVAGVTDPLQVTDLSFTLDGTSDLAAIDSVAVYGTGTSPVFSTADLFAGKIEKTGGEFTFSGATRLLPGDNYFWLACDVAAAAPPGAVLDAICSGMVAGGVTYVPADGDPPGHRVVRSSIPAQPAYRGAVIPLPQQMVIDTGKKFLLTPATAVVVSDTTYGEGEKAAAFLRRATGYPFPVTVGGDAAGNISLALLPAYNDTLGKEGYRLQVDDQGVRIEANTTAGIFYGFQTLRQLLPAATESPTAVTGVRWDVPWVKITDWPRYSWRGMHLDVSRHFFGVDFVKEYLDIMAMNKLNRFHWHLTDDQGWRIEIKSKPKLQSIAAWRTCNGVKYGGYYTQEQIREIVHYADSLHIMIIPEIEMPGHTIEVLAAYPELSCTTDTSDHGGPFSVRCGAGISSHIFCAGKDATFQFIEDVLTEVADLFPGPYIHLGGDEAVKTQWQQCRDCQARMAAEGLANEQQLQRWFMEQVGDFLATKNKQWIGWSEITWGGVPEGSTVMSWLGEGAAVAAARAGHDAVLTPSNTLYLNKPNTDLPEEPPGQGRTPITLQQVYFYDPMPEGLTPQQQEHILGPHGCLWTEWISAYDHAEYMILPRLLALAEIGWTARSDDYNAFLRRVYPQYERFALLGYNARKLVFPGDVLPDRIVTCEDADSIVLKADVPADSYYWNDEKNTTVDSIVVHRSGTYKCYVGFMGETRMVSTEVVFNRPAGKPEVDTTGTAWVVLGDADSWLWFDSLGTLVAVGDTFRPPGGGLTTAYSVAGVSLVSKKGAVHITDKTYAKMNKSDFLNDAPAFSFEGWFNIHGYDRYDRLFSKTLTNSNRIAAELADGRILFEVARATNAYGMTGEGTLPTDGWHHLAFVFDGSGQNNEERLKVYIDGQESPLTFTGTIPEITTNSPIPFTIGFASANPNMDFTEVSIWDRALSQNEVLGHMHMELSGNETGLVYYLKTEETEGNVLENSSRNNQYGAVLVNMLQDTRETGYLDLMLFGCESERWNISDVATTLHTPRLQGRMTIAPNPSDGNFSVSLSMPGNGKTHLAVYNMYGKRLLTKDLGNGRTFRITLSLSFLPPGTYILEAARGDLFRRKIFIKQ